MWLLQLDERDAALRFVKGRGLMDAAYESVQERRLQILRKDADFRTQPSSLVNELELQDPASEAHMQPVLKILLDL